ncbi:MAG: hypothetical protein U0T83_01365 [Bacteriovoracaceae bacterium]
MLKILLSILIFNLTTFVYATNVCNCAVFENASTNAIKTGTFDSSRPGALFNFESVKCFFVSGCSTLEADTLSIMCRAYGSEFSYSACHRDEVNLIIASAKKKTRVSCSCSVL